MTVTLAGVSSLGVEDSWGEPRMTGVTVITLGHPEVGPDTGSADLVSRSTVVDDVLVTVTACSGGCSSSLSLMVITSRGRD